MASTFFNIPSRPLFAVLFVVAILACFSATVAASPIHEDRQAALSDGHVTRKELTLLVDRQPLPIIPFNMAEDATKTACAPASKRSLSTDPNASSVDFQVPVPLDTGLSNNFTNGCANFISRLRASDAFNNCHPFSLLLQTSSGFFDASKSYLRITQTLDATCQVDAQQCKGIMDGFARDLVAASACKPDYDNSNAIVIQTYNGLVAYQPAYAASCLRDDEGRYCFANAVSNASAVRDSLPYYLPVGQLLPGGSRPTCNTCLQEAMSIFASYSSNASQPLSKTYDSAAQQISVSCGQSFLTVAAAPMKGGAAAVRAAISPVASLLLMLLIYTFC